MRTAPKIFIITAIAVSLSMLIELPIEAVNVIGILCFGFLLDVLFDMYSRHQEALLWIIEHVHLTDKPLGESDAPESLKKLLRREEDRKNQ